MVCENCGEDISVKVRFCPICGVKVEQEKNANNISIASLENKKVITETQEQPQKNKFQQSIQEIKEEWDSDPDIPKSTIGRLGYIVVGFFLLGLMVYGGIKLVQYGINRFNGIITESELRQINGEDAYNQAIIFADQWLADMDELEGYTASPYSREKLLDFGDETFNCENGENYHRWWVLKIPYVSQLGNDVQYVQVFLSVAVDHNEAQQIFMVAPD